MVEPPSIFIGRGSHPSLGKIKWRINPSDITLNLSKDAPVPILLNGKWGNIVHETNSYWLASWKCPITEKTKYVWLSDKSSIKGNKDMEKFEVARKLGTIIDKIRKNNIIAMGSRDEKTRQLAVVLYLIDYFALRIGNEKGSDEADTVGTVSLRVEHLTLLDNNKIKLDFLGKDSVRFVSIFKVTELVHKNLTAFVKGKTKNDNIFDLITTSMVNAYLSKKMKKLTARVFRTYNASKLYEEEIQNAIFNSKFITINPSKGFSGKISSNFSDKFSDKLNSDKFSDKFSDKSKEEILKILNDANIAVAILCNHQKNVGKSDNKLDILKDKISKLDKNSSTYNSTYKKLKESEKNLKEKEKYKHLALGTSKLNYIDPRITISILNKFNIPLSNTFNISQMEKFAWAINELNGKSNFKF